MSDPSRLFLQLCLRSRIDPDALSAASELAANSSLDWEQVGTNAQKEALEPLLYAAVRGRQLVPPQLEQALGRAYQRSKSRNTLLLGELKEILFKFKDLNIPVILLKGAALIRTVYGDGALRPMLDLDLLVHKHHVETALRIFHESGYGSPRTEQKAGNTLAFENEWLLHRSVPIDLWIEPHWSLFDSPYYQYTLSLDWFWQTAVPVKVSSAPAFALGPEAEIIYLCGHAVLHHRTSRLLWRHDIAETISFYRTQIDWDSVLNRARQYDLVLPLQQMLPRVAEDWGVPIPPEVLEHVRNLSASRTETRVFAHLTSDRTVGRRFWSDLVNLPNFRLRLQFALNNLFPSPAYMRERYRIRHPLLYPPLYLYRWIIGVRTALQRHA